MEKKYVIMCRYEHWTSEGKVFTKWFYHDTHQRTLDEANEQIKKTKTDFGFIDQKTHLKHEYKVEEYDIYKKFYDSLIERINELSKKSEEYFKSDEYKELKKKKRQAAKERKEHQQKYIAEHPIE